MLIDFGSSTLQSFLNLIWKLGELKIKMNY